MFRSSIARVEADPDAYAYLKVVLLALPHARGVHAGLGRLEAGFGLVAVEGHEAVALRVAVLEIRNTHAAVVEGAGEGDADLGQRFVGDGRQVGGAPTLLTVQAESRVG
jgi:hypothetical protein